MRDSISERAEQEHINALGGYRRWQSYVIRTSWERFVLSLIKLKAPCKSCVSLATQQAVHFEALMCVLQELELLIWIFSLVKKHRCQIPAGVARACCGRRGPHAG